MKAESFYSHGKLLITGEYLVLDGAKALAIPSKFGQSLKVETASSSSSNWLSYDDKKQVWVNTQFNLLDLVKTNIKGKDEIENRLFNILRAAYKLNPAVFTSNYNFTTHLEFPKNWGLGTSSTLIANIAKWADVDPYALLASTFGGSGYDLACANANSAVVFQLKKSMPKVEQGNIPKPIQPFIYFIYLDQKQNSREAIASYKDSKPKDIHAYISEINSITETFQATSSLVQAQTLIKNHEKLISEVLNIKPIQERLFPDFDGCIKSLGGWGGDFIMALSSYHPSTYFNKKGFKTVLSYEEMSL